MQDTMVHTVFVINPLDVVAVIIMIIVLFVYLAQKEED